MQGYQTNSHKQTKPAKDATSETQPTLTKYQLSFMRSIFIKASPLMEPMQRMLPPIAVA